MSRFPWGPLCHLPNEMLWKITNNSLDCLIYYICNNYSFEYLKLIYINCLEHTVNEYLLQPAVDLIYINVEIVEHRMVENALHRKLVQEHNNLPAVIRPIIQMGFSF